MRFVGRCRAASTGLFVLAVLPAVKLWRRAGTLAEAGFAAAAAPWLTGRFPPHAASRGAYGLRGLRAGEEGISDFPEASELGSQDWRSFRARLVQKELQHAGGTLQGSQEEEGGSRAGWAHVTPLIEKGSVLLTLPGDHFVLNQQYFHKVIVLIIRHGEEGDMGLILNRPTAFMARDLGLGKADSMLDQFLKPLGLIQEWGDWRIWFGGDCQGLNAPSEDFAITCLHTSRRLAGVSEEIIQGVFLIELSQAKALVSAGDADQDEFRVLLGYCGWAPGQLQAELDRGGSWVVAATDRSALLGDLQSSQASDRASVEEALARARAAAGVEGAELSVTADDVGDGTREWEQLLGALGLAASTTQSTTHADAVLGRWVERNLVPRLSASSQQPSLPELFDWLVSQSSGLQAAATATGGVAPAPATAAGLRTGAVLRSSPTEWMLGSPTWMPKRRPWRMSGAQYLHKAVLLLTEDWEPGQTATMMLLNGPRIGTLGGRRRGGAAFFGGPVRESSGGQCFLEVPGGGIYGLVRLPPGDLEELLRLGALELAKGTSLSDVLLAPAAERWEAAGGQINSIRDAVLAAMGDEQRQRWFRRFLGLELQPGE